MILFRFCSALPLLPRDTDSAGFSRTSAAALKVWQPDSHIGLDLLFSAEKDGLVYLLLETICIAIVGTAIGAFLAAPLAFLNTERFVPAPAPLFLNLIIMAIHSRPVSDPQSDLYPGLRSRRLHRCPDVSSLQHRTSHKALH